MERVAQQKTDINDLEVVKSFKNSVEMA